MADNARPPVAVRIVRPYDTEEAFLENELETVGKTSVILIGAHSRPTGVILRFEVVLASGATVLRGEGRVLAHKESAFRGQPGLALRFTRLDPKSKTLVDRAAAIREARLAGDATRSAPPPPPAPSSSPVSVSSPPPSQVAELPHAGRAESGRPPGRTTTSGRPSAPPPPSMPPDPVLAHILTSPTPPPPAPVPPVPVPASVPVPAAEEEHPSAADAAAPDDQANAASEEPSQTSDVPPRPQAITSLPMPPLSSPPSALPSARPVAPSVAPSSAPPAATPTEGHDEPRPSVAPSDRDSLLARLRQRAASLTEEQMAAILRRQG